MSTFSPLLDVNPDDPWSSVAALPPETLRRMGVRDVALRDFRRAIRKLAAKPEGDPQRLEGERLWRPAVVEMKRQAAGVFDSAEALEIDMALDAGSVSLISDGTRFEDSAHQQVGWFRDRLAQALADPSSTVLLDDVATEFLRESGDYADGLPTVADHRSRRSAVGAGLVERLPTFPDAPMSHVLEARQELADGRARYRVSVKKLAERLQSSALDATLPSEIDDLWHDEVRPTLESLRKTAATTRVGVETGKRLLTEGYGLPTLLVAMANLPDLSAALPTPAAAAALVGRVAAAGAQEAFKARSAVRQHDLVYLLDIDKKLGRARKV